MNEKRTKILVRTMNESAIINYLWARQTTGLGMGTFEAAAISHNYFRILWELSAELLDKMAYQ